MPEITIDEDRLAHIFRDADGHFGEDTEVNRRLLIATASKPANRLGVDRVGNEWYAERIADGGEVWVRVRGGKIVNGGINHEPRLRSPR